VSNIELSSGPVQELVVEVDLSQLRGELTLHAAARAAHAFPHDVTAQARWSTSNASVASVSDAGVVRALGTGRVTVTASFGGASGSLDLDCREGIAASLTRVHHQDWLPLGLYTALEHDLFYSRMPVEGQGRLLEVSVAPEDAALARYEREAWWILPRRAGHIEVTLRRGELARSATFEVRGLGVRLSPFSVHDHAGDPVELTVGDDCELYADLFLENGDAISEPMNLSLSSSDPSVLDLERRRFGIPHVIAKAPGEVTVTGRCLSARSELRVVVKPYVEFTNWY
jgi:hypothetical protein